MAFGTVPILLLVLAALLVFAGAYLMFARDWFIQFLRGFAAFGLMGVALLIVLAGINVASYAQLDQGGELANVSFTRVSDQLYEAELVNVLTGQQSKFSIEGDLWQLESRQMRIVGSSVPFYMPERISGRFFSIEQQRLSSFNSFDIADKSMGLNLWGIFAGKDIGLISGNIQKSRFVPMADGAMYSVRVGDNGLEARPVNEMATAAVNEWQ